MRGSDEIAPCAPLLFGKIFLVFTNYQYYQIAKSLVNQGLSSVAGSVAEGSGSTTSTATETRRSCPSGTKALICFTKLAALKAPEKQNEKFSKVIFCRHIRADTVVLSESLEVVLRRLKTSLEGKASLAQVNADRTGVRTHKLGKCRRPDAVLVDNVLHVALLQALRKGFELCVGDTLFQVERVGRTAHFSHLLCRVLR